MVNSSDPVTAPPADPSPRHVSGAVTDQTPVSPATEGEAVAGGTGRMTTAVGVCSYCGRGDRWVYHWYVGEPWRCVNASNCRRHRKQQQRRAERET